MTHFTNIPFNEQGAARSLMQDIQNMQLRMYGKCFDVEPSYSNSMQELFLLKEKVLNDMKKWEEEFKVIDPLKIGCDTNGNSRIVVHWLSFSPKAKTYEEALSISRSIGGKKYRGKRYGGGIVFQESSIFSLTKLILQTI